MTVINTTTTGKNADNIRIVSEIDHWNIIEGMVTITTSPVVLWKLVA